jgi:hypothetical protein
MKIGFVFAAVTLGTITASSAIADETLENKGTITATLDAKAKTVTIVIKGKEAGVWVNKEYPIKCSLTIAEGGKLDKAEVKKEDAVYVDAKGHEGKADSATFKVGANKKVSGECKLVLCTANSCSSPFKQSFSSN